MAKKKKLDLSEVLQEYMGQRGFHTEGESGVKSLEKLVQAMGYDDRYGTPLENFLGPSGFL